MKSSFVENPASPSWDEFETEIRRVGISDINAAVEYVAQTIEQYYSVKGETSIVFWYDNLARAISSNDNISHNDLHGGNVMRNADGEFEPDSLIMIDWDLASYGYRAFDIAYHFHKWPIYPTEGRMSTKFYEIRTIIGIDS